MKSWKYLKRNQRAGCDDPGCEDLALGGLFRDGRLDVLYCELHLPLWVRRAQERSEPGSLSSPEEK